MKRFYTVDAVYRGGGVGYWNPITKRFQYGDTPDNLYSKYTEALKEYREAIQEAEYCDSLKVRLRERVEDEMTHYHLLKERSFVRNDQSPEGISDEIRDIGKNMQSLSSRAWVVSDIPGLSKETREEVTLISKQLDRLSFLVIKLQYKIFKDLDKDV